MDISRFFIDRPRFATVLSLFIFLIGALAIPLLPISEYPEVAPPQVVVRAQYPGANPRVIAETVATPLEEQINGLENVLYFESQATGDGGMTLTVTFKIGTHPEAAETAVQNRINRALPRLPEIVRTIGVTTEKAASNLTMVVHLVSPDNSRDALYLRNYGTLNVRDDLLRVPGMGSVLSFGAGDYAMRIWLDPQKLAARSMTASEVVGAIREQNTQVAAGVVGASPAPKGTDFQLAINAQGRLASEEEFSNIIVRSDTKTGAMVRVKDIGRVEISANTYALRSLLNNKEAAAIAIFQAPGSNALAISDNVRATMEKLKPGFPKGVDYAIVYDPTRFVQTSIEKVVHTLFEAVALVVLVVIIFLQTWRASIIPLVAVPVSIVGTFAVLLLLGFSINTLTLFGLVLAIGIVVDDAIVVVENVERNIQDGLTPHAATVKAMQEVSGPIIAIALVLCAVFIPLTLVPGLSGQFYKQFAVTIAISTVISAFNSLTLSPALAAILLRPHDAPKDALTRGMDKVFGRFFHWFNRVFHRRSEDYGRGVNGILKRKSVALIVYALLLGSTALIFTRIPSGFVPAPDKQYLIGVAQLPAGSSLDRTEEVIRQMSAIALKVPGIVDSVAFPGLSVAGFSASPNEGIVFFGLDSFDKRTRPGLSKEAILGQVNGAIQQIQGARMFVVPPPPVDGLGVSGGFKIQVQDRSSQGEQALYGAVWGAALGPIYGNPNSSIGTPYSTYDINVPQLFANVDRTKAKQMGVPLGSIYDTLQINLGSLYVNDFTKFGKTYQVIVQADAPFRAKADDIVQLKTRNGAGEMVPLGSLMSVEPTFGPTRVTRYNGFPSADINGAPKPGFSSGQAEAEIEQILKGLPRGMGYEWTDLSYQDRLTRDVTIPGIGIKVPTLAAVLMFSVLLVILVLAAQYESWSLPLAIILIVPMCILSALFGVWLSHFPPFGQSGDLNIFTQVALVVLVGLACKNAILIVEFAKELEEQGRSIRDAVIEACRLRLRPILMTSIAFCAGVIPLILGSGAGSEMRRAMGIAVFAGMLGVTLFGIFLTPVFYSLLRASTEKRRARAAAPRSRPRPMPSIPASMTNPRRAIEMKARLTPLALAALLSACAAPGLPKGPANLAPEKFAQLPAINAQANPGAATMTAAFVDSAQLRRVVDEVLANNRDLRAAAARLKQAEALADAAGARRLPSVGAGASASRQRAPNDQDQDQFNNFSSYGVNATAGWEVDLWGRASATAQAAGYDARGAALDRDAAALSLAGTALNLQAQLIGLGHRLKFAKEALGVQNQLLDLVKARVGAGRGTALDQARAEALVAQTSASVPALRNAACLTRLQLDVLRGQPPADCDKADSDPLPAMPEPRLISLGTLPDPAGLLAQRPDVKAAAVRAQAAAARAQVAWAARWPTLGLTGQIGWSAGRAGDLFKSGTQIHSLAAALNWNFLDFGARKAEESAARAGFDAAVAGAEQAQLTALQDAQGSLSTLRETELQATAQATAADATTRARELALKRYDAGVADFYSLLTAEQDRLAAQDALIQVQISRATALLAVHKAFAARLTAVN